MFGYIVCFKNKWFRSKWHVVKDKESILLGKKWICYQTYVLKNLKIKSKVVLKIKKKWYGGKY